MIKKEGAEVESSGVRKEEPVAVPPPSMRQEDETFQGFGDDDGDGGGGWDVEDVDIGDAEEATAKVGEHSSSAAAKEEEDGGGFAGFGGGDDDGGGWDVESLDIPADEVDEVKAAPEEEEKPSGQPDSLESTTSNVSSR